MGIFGKIKGILFDEEEVEIPVIGEKDKKKEEDIFERTIVKDEPEKATERISEREMAEPKRSFTFPEVTDDLEVNTPKPERKLNVMDYERRQPQPVKRDRVNIFTKPEKENKPFTPSPVISPVYGIIDNEKKVDKITQSATPKPRSTGPIDVDEVRKKAYGTLEDQIEITINKPIDTFYEADDIVITNEVESDDTKSIDDLIIDDLNNTDSLELRSTKHSDVLNDIEDVIDDTKEVKTINPDDTIESDLFNLIDSMYDKREDGDE